MNNFEICQAIADKQFDKLSKPMQKRIKLEWDTAENGYSVMKFMPKTGKYMEIGIVCQEDNYVYFWYDQAGNYRDYDDELYQTKRRFR